MRTDGLTVVLEKVDSALAWAPPWLAGIVVLVGSAAIALLLYNWALRLLGRIGARYGTLPQLLIDKGRGPVAAVLLVMVLGAALPAANFSHAVTLALGHVLLVAFVLAVGWGLNAALALSATIYLSRFRVDLADNLLARKHVTQVRILQRAIQVLILIVTAGTALMTINAVRQFGVSLFASAGAAGLVVGLAARPVLSNLLAGIQIALAQPIRVEDAVVVEGEWGWKASRVIGPVRTHSVPTRSPSPSVLRTSTSPARSAGEVRSSARELENDPPPLLRQQYLPRLERRL
jgi:small-conductance mechanosensitive channel